MKDETPCVIKNTTNSGVNMRFTLYRVKSKISHLHHDVYKLRVYGTFILNRVNEIIGRDTQPCLEVKIKLMLWATKIV